MRKLTIAKDKFFSRNDIFNQYIKDIDKTVLTVEEEIALCERISKGDTKAADKLIRHNLKFVISVAKQYMGMGININDLISSGNLGLTTAAYKFDHTKGFKFISYAVWHIRKEILETINNHGAHIRIPTNKKTALLKIQKRIESLQQLHSEDNVIDFIDDDDINDEMIDTYNKYYVNNVFSYDKPLNDDSNDTLINTFQDNNALPPDILLMKDESKNIILNLLSELPFNERECISYYFGFKEFHIERTNQPNRNVTFAEIANELNISAPTVKANIQKALKKLKILYRKQDHIKQKNTTPPKKKETFEDIVKRSIQLSPLDKKILLMNKEGYSITMISSILKMNINYVYRIINQNK